MRGNLADLIHQKAQELDGSGFCRWGYRTPSEMRAILFSSEKLPAPAITILAITNHQPFYDQPALGCDVTRKETREA